MGAAGSISMSSVSISNASRSNSEKSYNEEDDPVTTAPLAPILLSSGTAADIILPGAMYRKINKALVEKCKQSWLRIVSNHSGEHGERGFGAFCSTFFHYMEELDTDSDVLIKFQPRPASLCVDRESLLLRVINFMLSIPSDNFKVKSKIRSLGRAHARVGVVDKHFEMFARSMLKSIAVRLGQFAVPDVIGAWLDLLAFTIHQLTFDKINFKAHFNTSSNALEINTSMKSLDIDGAHPIVVPIEIMGDAPRPAGSKKREKFNLEDRTMDTKEITPQMAQDALEGQGLAKLEET